MIDARDYPTHEELKQAMILEHYISELTAIDANLTSLELAFNFWKSQYEIQMEALRSKKEILKEKIDSLEASYIYSQSKKDKE